MTTKQLDRFSIRIFKVWRSVEKQAKTDREMAAYADKLKAIWQESYDRAKTLARLEAERKDKSQVLFEVFVPSKHGWDTGTRFTRTPHRFLEKAWYSQNPATELRNGPAESWESDFARAMGHKEAA